MKIHYEFGGIWVLGLLACLSIGCQPADEEISGELAPEAVTTLTQEHNSWTKQDLNRRIRIAMLPYGGAKHFTLPDDDQLDLIPEDDHNKLNVKKVELGKLLFHETGLGVDNVRPDGEMTYSCASCHNADAGFQANRRQGIGEGGVGFFDRQPDPLYDDIELDVQPIRSPTAMNGAYQRVMLWGGQLGGGSVNKGTEARWAEGTGPENNFLGLDGLETQAVAGMETHRLSFVRSGLTTNPTYIQLFDEAFPELDPSERMTDLNAALAIAAFERTMIANRAPWQEYLRGDLSAMTTQQMRGALLFMTKADCVTCHRGPALNSESFHALGMGDLSGPDIVGPDKEFPERFGRGGFTANAFDLYKFKTPQLYNLTDSEFYGHGGTFTSIRQVLEYKNDGVPENAGVPDVHISEHFEPLRLRNHELDDLEAFLTYALYDPNLNRYEPGTLPSGKCTPHNDPLSRIELGCD